MKKICIATGTRAEYGLLKSIISIVDQDKDLNLYLAVTGAHLSHEFGMTVNEIIDDGYKIDAKIEMLLSSDSSVGISKSMSLALNGFSEYFDRIKPDIIIILGDRYEMLMVAIAAMISRVPVAHIHGGELTEGLIDEAIRHSITKMSYIHFPTTNEYRKRIIQLGENPENVYNVGALGVENIHKIDKYSREDLSNDLGIDLSKETVLFTYHPETLNDECPKKQVDVIFSVLDKFPEYQIVFTKANADTNGRIINEMIDKYVAYNNERCIVRTSLGQRRYLSLLNYCKFVIGNSSSGLIEVPSFNIPTINIGDRQRGRICASSVINCRCEEIDIENAIKKAISYDFQQHIKIVNNPYEKDNTAMNIVNIIKKRLDSGIDIKKRFYDIEI